MLSPYKRVFFSSIIWLSFEAETIIRWWGLGDDSFTDWLACSFTLPLLTNHLRSLFKSDYKKKPLTLFYIQLPHGIDISDDCRHLLLGLLKRNPDERMSFEEFLSHPFIDLEHQPCAGALQKAVSVFMLYLIYERLKI